MNKSEYQRQWRLRNPNWFRQWQRRNRKKLTEQQKARYRKNPEKFRAIARKSAEKARKNNPEKMRERSQRSYYQTKEKESSMHRLKKRAFVISALIRMAHDDGLWELLEREYENGRRSVRQTDT